MGRNDLGVPGKKWPSRNVAEYQTASLYWTQKPGRYGIMESNFSKEKPSREWVGWKQGVKWQFYNGVGLQPFIEARGEEGGAKTKYFFY